MLACQHCTARFSSSPALEEQWLAAHHRRAHGQHTREMHGGTATPFALNLVRRVERHEAPRSAA